MSSINSTDVLGEILQAYASATHFTDAIIHEGFPIIVQSPAGNHPIPGGQAKKVSHSEIVEMAKQVYLMHAVISGKPSLSLEKEEDIQKVLEKGAIKAALDIDVAGTSTAVRLRFTIVRSRGGGELAAVVRRIPHAIPELSTLRLPQAAASLTKGAGLVLLTGPTKQGKSTTAASMLQHIRDTRSGHIVTIEDPIEYTLHGRISLDGNGHTCPVTSREVGSDVTTYIEGVEDALRLNPTTIMIGEIRDAATAKAALNMGESGHLVISTMQSTTAVGAVRKLMALVEGSAAARLSLTTCLRGVIRTCLAPSADRSRYVPAYEFFLNKGEFAKALKDTGSSVQALLNKGDLPAHGQSLMYSLEMLAKEGLITHETAKTLSSEAGYGDSI